MASFECRINSDIAHINIYLPVKTADLKTYNKIMNDVKKLVMFCNSKEDYESESESEKMGIMCEYCEKSFKKVNGLTVHMKTCTSVPIVDRVD